MHLDINLLPWRTLARKAQAQRFAIQLAGVCALALVSQWLVGMYLTGQQQQQKERNDYLQAHIAQLERRIGTMKVAQAEHSAVYSRLQAVAPLQQARSNVTQLMSLLQQMVPTGVYLDEIKLREQKVTLRGIGESYAQITALLDNLERAERVKQVEMHSIVRKSTRFGEDYQTFVVSFVFSWQVDEVDQVDQVDQGDKGSKATPSHEPQPLQAPGLVQRTSRAGMERKHG
ncbi:pilus assembly protein PilN [Vibrio sp. SM6]|uniref:Pilus assembly protein PilN n=1 Tax=Vibrio agarilyticus TaxID=2726741 RepID=A0A7X8TSJ0_9VIBR|nr:PilN domain-containing protein [Vibrio agarilyticus]NLS13483.1 pilus assembly protein PilN [Vibrio agarilyticus]